MTKIINFNYGNGSENFMLSTIEFQIMCSNKYLALKDDNTSKYTQIILTNNNTSSTSKWKLLQSISTDKVMLFNVKARSIITTSDDRKSLWLSSLEFDDDIWSYNIQKNETINGSAPDILYPKSNNNITPKICFWNIIDGTTLKLNQAGENVYLSQAVQNECCFEFAYKGKKIDFPGNCNIDGLITKESNCIYFNLQTSGKYCFTRSKDEVLIFFNEGSSKCNNFKQYVFDIRDIDLSGNSIERYSNGSSVRFWLKNDSEAQRWFILKDNFGRILIKPIKHNTFLDFHLGQLNEQAKLQNNWDYVHPANIYTVTSNNLIQIVNYDYDGCLNYNAKTEIVNDKKIFLKEYGKKINFYKAGSSEILTFNQLQFNELTGYENIPNTIIFNNFTNSDFQLGNIPIFNDITLKINNNKYQYISKKNEIESKKTLTENYFQNAGNSINLENDIKFKYNNNNISLDIVDQIINSNISLEKYQLLKILFELYEKLKGKDIGSNAKWAEFILKGKNGSDFINTKEKLHSLGWNRYFTFTSNGDTISSSYLSNSINYLLNQLNIFIIHLLDKIFYNGTENLSNDFISLFTYDNKLCSFAITTNILYYINYKLNNTNDQNNIFDTMLPTLNYDINTYGGIAYWNDDTGYWCNSKTDINWSIIERDNDDKNSYWNNKKNKSIISSDNYDNVFRVYTNIEKNEYNISNNLNTSDSIDLLKTSHEHVTNVPEQTYTYINTGISFKEYLSKDDNLKIGYRPKGCHPSGEVEQWFKIKIGVTEKEKISTTKSPTSQYGSWGNEADATLGDQYPIETQHYIPTKIQIKVYDTNNNLVGTTDLSDYRIKIADRYGGCDKEQLERGLCDVWDNVYDSDYCQSHQYHIKILKINPTDIIRNEGFILNNKFYHLGSQLENLLKKKDTLEKKHNNFDNSLIYKWHIYYNALDDGEENVYINNDWWIQTYNDDSDVFPYTLFEPQNENWGKNDDGFYGNSETIDEGVYVLNTPYKGNVYDKEVNGKNCDYNDTKQWSNSANEPQARCFVVPNENLKIRLFDDRFDYMLLYWLNANKESLSNKLKDEIIDLCSTNPKLLLPYRIWKNYIGCTKNNYINLENVIGPPLLYVPKESNLTEYSCYYAESTLSGNIKKIEYIYEKDGQPITKLISKFTSKLIIPTNFLDQLYYAFINLSNDQNVNLNDENFYAYLTLRFNFSDLLNYIGNVYDSTIELKILSNINNVEDFKDNYGFLITNDNQLEKANSAKFKKIGDYNVPYIINNPEYFEYKNKKLSFYFFSNYSPKDNTIDLTANNINMNFSALKSGFEEYNVIRMTSTHNKSSAKSQTYLVPIDRSNY